ncbi:MAG: FUSC family protein [Arthrospira sp. SH-MAG29]|nr:FUSC family protein [Arthrospira sp. SH-MAG29]MBS0015448.1 FUSC family protein [Arthrospira sp. SH-MAG29]
MNLANNHLFNFLLQFEKTIEAYRGIRAGIALAVPLVMGRLMGYPETGFYIGLTGVFFILGAVGGPYKIRAKTAIATLLAGLLAIGLGTLISHIIWLKLLMTFLWMFAVGYAAVYGHPGVMTGIVAGIFFLFTIHTPPGDIIVAGERMFIGLVGGIWAIALWFIFWPLQPYLPLKKAIADCYAAIADYIQVVLNNSTSVSVSELQQVKGWREKLQLAKDALVINRQGRRGTSEIGQAAVILIQDIEYLMTAISTLIKLSGIHRDKPENMTVKILLDEAFKEIVMNLENLVQTIRNQPAQVNCDRLQQITQALDEQQYFQRKTIGNQVDAYVSLIALVRLVEVLNRLISLLERTYLVVEEMKPTTIGGENNSELSEITILLEKRDQPWFQPLLDNFSFDSAIFRHGLRLAIATSVAVAIATIESIPRGFWISLTVLLVLQHDFGSTFRRFFQRILGTVLGALITPVFTVFIYTQAGLEAIAIMSVSVAFSLLRFNYGVAVFFITVYAVTLEESRTFENAWIATLRVIATLIGSGLAFMAAFFLFRDRQEQQFWRLATNAISCSRDYFQIVMNSYLSNNQSADYHAISQQRHQNRLAQFNAQISLQKLIDDPQTSQLQIEIALTLMTNLTRFSRAITVLIDQLNDFSGTDPHPALATFVSRIDLGLSQLETCLKYQSPLPPIPDTLTPSQEFQVYLKGLQQKRLVEFANQEDETPTRQVLLDYSILALEIEDIADYLQGIYQAVAQL